MKTKKYKLIGALLAGTALGGLPLRAQTYIESDFGSFGHSFLAPTSLNATVPITIAGNVDNYLTGTADFFRFGVGSMAEGASTAFSIVFTASRVGGDVAPYYGIDQVAQAASSGSASVEGGATLSPSIYFGLPSYSGAATITGFGGFSASTTSGAEGTSVQILTAVGNDLTTLGGSGSSAGGYQIITPDLDPVLTFYDGAGNPVSVVEVTEGNSIVITGLTNGPITLKVDNPFDYSLSLATGDAAVPEPASLGLFGIGAAGIAAARRRRRTL